jgi:hypothetical protein
MIVISLNGVGAQTGLRSDLYSSIADTAVASRQAGEESNLDLRGAVIQAIVADPGQVEQNLAVAVSLAPQE